MLKSQLRHAYCVLILGLCFVQVSSFKVVSDSHHPVHRDHVVSVDRSGFKADNTVALTTHSQNNRVEGSSRFRRYGTAFNSDKVFVLISALVLWVVMAVLCVASPWSGASDDVKSPRSPRGDTLSRKTSVMSTYNVMEAESKDAVGSFAARERNANAKDKPALELLRRCGIVQPEEVFSLEHIEECIAVAKVMLRHKPLSVWLSLGNDAGRESFSDYVSKIASALPHGYGDEDASYPPETHVPQSRSPDSPRKDERMFSPGSIQHSHVSAVSLGSAVSFGDEEGAGSPPTKALSAPPTDLSVPAGGLPPTIPPVPPQSIGVVHKSPTPILNCYSQVEQVPANYSPLMDAEWTQLQNTNPLPEKFPNRRFSKVEDAAPPSSNEAMLSGMPSAQSLGGDGGGFLSVLSPPSVQPPASGLSLQAPQERVRLIPSSHGLPLTSPADTPTHPTSPPKEKLFSFKPQEVMAPPPEPSTPEEERALRPPGSLRGSLPDGAVRRLSSNSDLIPLPGQRSPVSGV